MSQVTRRELSLYYRLRRTTYESGLTDKSFSRPTIPRAMPVDQITRQYFDKCYIAELEALELGVKMERLSQRNEETEGWMDEVYSLREQVNSLRRSLGLPEEEF